MKNLLTYLFAGLLFAGCSSNNVLKHQFDSSLDVDSHEFSLNRLGENMPADWEDFQYMVLEIKSSTAQRFLLGIDTDNGLHEKRTHILPGAWVRLCIPLEYFREKPRPSNDLAATVNKPLNGVGFMHIEGGTVGPLTGVKGLSFKYYTPLDNPTIEIRSVQLTNEYMGNAYLEETPFVDRYGQWNLAEFEGKVHSDEELQQAWDNDAANMEDAALPRSQYGGFLDKQVDGTGFFRVEKIDGKWWFIDPEGYLFLSIGANGIGSGGGGSSSTAQGLENMFEVQTPTMTDPRSGREMHISFGEMNQIKRYGGEDVWRDNWAEMTIKRMKAWGLNTGSVRPSTTPYLGYVRASGIQNIFGLQDIYVDDYEKVIEEGVKNSVATTKDDPYLIGYFLQNEPSWLEQEPRVCELILGGEDVPLKTTLRQYLEVNGDTPQSRTEFVHSTFRKHIETLTKYLRKYDPNHLSLGIRFGHSSVPHENILAICKDFFDVFSFNTYRIAPNVDYINAIASAIDLPMILGEFHFGSIDRGMAPGLVQVADQQERAVAFRYFAENAFSNPSLIGIAWFQYTDQGLLGRNDGERYNIGLVDVLDIPYPIVDGLKAAAEDAYAVHAGIQAPFSQLPKGLRGNEDDLKSKSNQ